MFLVHNSAGNERAAEKLGLIFRLCQTDFCLLEMSSGLWSIEMGQIQEARTAFI